MPGAASPAVRRSSRSSTRSSTISSSALAATPSPPRHRQSTELLSQRRNSSTSTTTTTTTTTTAASRSRSRSRSPARRRQLAQRPRAAADETTPEPEADGDGHGNNPPQPATPTHLPALRSVAPDRRSAFAIEAERMAYIFRTELYESEKPRQILLLGVALVILCYFAVQNDQGQTEGQLDASTTVRSALVAATLCFLLYSILQLRDSLMVRPHPAFWRCIHGLGILYFLGLAATFVQPLAGARWMMRVVAPTPSLRSDEAVLDSDHLDCSINGGTIWRQLSSVWFLSHSVGWMATVMIARNLPLVMFTSFLFEAVEVSLQFIIPQFVECWWDSIFMDFLGANMVGIFAGHLLNKFLNNREYHWMDDKWGTDAPTFSRLWHRLAQPFSPYAWSEYHWQFFSTFGRFLAAAAIVIVTTQIQIHSFFIFHILHIPPQHPFNGMRVLLLALLGGAGTAEWYEFVCHGAKRIGQNAWLVIATMVLEMAFIFRFGMQIEQFHASPPRDIWVPWALSLALSTIWVAIYFGTRRHRQGTRQQTISLLGFPCSRDAFLKALLVLAFTPLLTLFRHWHF